MLQAFDADANAMSLGDNRAHILRMDTRREEQQHRSDRSKTWRAEHGGILHLNVRLAPESVPDLAPGRNETFSLDVRLPMTSHAILTTVSERPGMLYAVSKVLADHSADIKYVDIHPGDERSELYLEFTLDTGSLEVVLEDLRVVDGVVSAEETPTFGKIYGKRIIVMGGGAQVGMVAMGAIAEADRHNIRGERISIDTIPLVGEHELAATVRAAGRLPRVKLLVLAGSLMGGEISVAVQDVRKNGLPVISLNMAGSVPDAADLVVSDPVQAGVMAVMAVADTAKFDLMRQLKKRY